MSLPDLSHSLCERNRRAYVKCGLSCQIYRLNAPGLGKELGCRVQVLPTDGAGCCRALLTAQAPAKRLAGLAARLRKRKPKGE